MLPTKAHESDAAFDLYSIDSKVIHPGNVEAISTGISMALPKGFYALVLSRSGLAIKHRVFVLNAPGLIDNGYRGEIMVVLFNAGSEDYSVVSGDRIAQIMFHRSEDVTLKQAFEFIDMTDRGANGLGSTGLASIEFLGDDEFSAPI
jgi:dUTP pyrophosphatase